MLRSALIWLSKARWAQQMITHWKIAWRVASRFVAGETLEEALNVVQRLNDREIKATLDHLGENTTDLVSAAQAVQDILIALDGIERAGQRANISVKLTQLGLLIDPEMAYKNLVALLTRAREAGNFIRVDMEDSSVTQQTLDLVLRAGEAGFKNTGAVLQSYLYRSEKDARELISRGIPVRLVKGTYKEPSSVAFPNKSDVDANFDRLTEILINGIIALGAPTGGKDGRFPPLAAIASHDEKRIRYAIAAAERVGLPKAALEFQMLYGIRRDLQEELVRLGHPLRIYVPYGTHWYPYLMRRMAERPANAWFFVSNFFQR